MSLTDALIGEGLKPTKWDKHGPAYSKNDVLKATIRKINTSDDFFVWKGNKMMEDTSRAIQRTEATINDFSHVMDRFNELEANIVSSSKKATSALKDSAERLAQGIARVEKAANFERLERYVGLLERAATAMNLLAELETSGKLDKIAGALK